MTRPSTHTHLLYTLTVRLQGVHEPRGASEDYMRLESLVQKVVSPYLGTHGLYSGDGSEAQCCVLGEWVRPRV